MIATTTPTMVNPSEVLFKTIEVAIHQAILPAVQANRPLTMEDHKTVEETVFQAIATKKDATFQPAIAALELELKRLHHAIDGYKPSPYGSGLLTGAILFR